jgi:hypothetical protein
LPNRLAAGPADIRSLRRRIAEETRDAIPSERI